MKAHSPLLIKFTAISLVATALIATGLGWVVSQRMVDDALKSAIGESVDVVQNVITPQVTADDFDTPTPDRVAGWQHRLREVIGRMDIARVKVWNASGQVVYSDNPALVGRVFPLAAEQELRQTLQAGRVVSDLSALKKGEADVEQPYGRLMQIYAPVVLPGSRQVAGAYEVYRMVGSLEARIADIKEFVWEAWAGAFSLLYASLFFFIQRAGRQMIQQQEDLQHAFEGTVRALVSAVDMKDSYTANHSSRVAEYAAVAAQALGLGSKEIEDIRMAAYLHDLGKIGVPDEVLRKPGALTPQEGWQMRRHPAIAAHILEEVPLSPRLKLAVRHNHERWDGTGYPDGLAGDEIPIEARILAVADAYEAMTANRPYRHTMGHASAVAELRRHVRTQFDPRVVEAFVRALEQQRISERIRKRAPAAHPNPRHAV
jgi:putative nucleotidyltransferase with HDIG domain